MAFSATNIVDNLLIIPFLLRDIKEQKLIIRTGRPQPDLEQVLERKRGQRAFCSKWYGKHDWLTGSVEKLSLFCWPCLLYPTDGICNEVWQCKGYACCNQNLLSNFISASFRHNSKRHHAVAVSKLQLFQNEWFGGNLREAHNIVDKLLECPLIQMTLDEKQNILQNGRPTPDLIERFQHFSAEWYEKFTWFTASAKRNDRLFCWACLLFPSDGDEKIWEANGFECAADETITFELIEESLYEHESTTYHNSAWMHLELSRGVFEDFNVVDKLLFHVPFATMDKREKMWVLSSGRPTPVDNVFCDERKSDRVSSPAQLYKRYDWLTAGASTKRLFCWPCIMFPLFAKDVISRDGFNCVAIDSKICTHTLQKSLEIHDALEEHKEALRKYNALTEERVDVDSADEKLLDKVKLIELVKRFPILYRDNYHCKDPNDEEKTWNFISAVINIPVFECRKIWAKIRNDFFKGLEKKKELQSRNLNRLTIKVEYEKEMAFLLLDNDEHCKRYADTSLYEGEDSPIDCKTYFNTSQRIKLLKLISAVKKLHRSPITYDSSSYEWNKIGDAMNRTGDVCCDMWRTIRRNYFKYMRRKWLKSKVINIAISTGYNPALNFLFPVWVEHLRIREHNIGPVISDNACIDDRNLGKEFNSSRNNSQDSIEQEYSLQISLIEAVKEHAALILPQSSNSYKCDFTNTDVWERISDCVKLPKKECQLMWKQLYEEYYKYLKNLPTQKTEEIQKLAKFLNWLIPKFFENSHPVEAEPKSQIFYNYHSVSYLRKLVHLVKQCPALYEDCSAEERINSWKMISKTLKVAPGKCAAEWSYLKARFDNPIERKRLDSILREEMRFFSEVKSLERRNIKESIYGYECKNHEKFVLAIKKFPVLYDEEHAYFFPDEITEAWTDVAKSGGYTVSTAKLVWEQLVAKYYLLQDKNKKNESEFSKFERDMCFLHASKDSMIPMPIDEDADERIPVSVELGLLDHSSPTTECGNTERSLKNLIEAVRNYPILYTTAETASAEQKNKIWEEIAAKFGSNVNDVKNIWNATKNYYKGYLKYEAKNPKKTCKSEFLSDMNFLEKQKDFTKQENFGEQKNEMIVEEQQIGVPSVFNDFCEFPIHVNLTDSSYKVSDHLNHQTYGCISLQDYKTEPEEDSYEEVPEFIPYDSAELSSRPFSMDCV